MNALTRFSAATIVLGALTSTATAQSNMTISGIIDTGLMRVNHVGDGTQSNTFMINGILSASNVSFQGKEDLGNGLSAIYQLQAGFNPSEGTLLANNQLFSRNAYVGLNGSFGSLTLGRHWNVNDDFFVAGDGIIKGGYNAGAMFRFSEFDAVSELYNNTIKYVTPEFGGLQGGLMVGLGENAGNFSAGSVTNIGLKYARGPFYIAIGHDREKDAADVNNTGNLYKLTVVGASYTIGNTRARLGFAHSDIGGPGKFQSIPSLSERKANAWEVGVDYKASRAFTASADFIYRKNTTLSNDTKVYRLLGLYALSMRTTLIANIAYLNNSDGASETFVNTNSTAAGGGFPNQTQTGVALGLRHLF